MEIKYLYAACARFEVLALTLFTFPPEVQPLAQDQQRLLGEHDVAILQGGSTVLALTGSRTKEDGAPHCST